MHNQSDFQFSKNCAVLCPCPPVFHIWSLIPDPGASFLLGSQAPPDDCVVNLVPVISPPLTYNIVIKDGTDSAPRPELLCHI